MEGAEVQSQQGSEGDKDDNPAESDPSVEADPRPVFEGNWATADGKARQAHLVRVNAWKQRNGLWGKGASAQPRGGKDADAQVAAILGSTPDVARLTSDGLRVLREIMNDSAAPATARVSAANAVDAREAREAQTQQDEEQARAVALLDVMPLPQQLDLLERIVRKDEPRGWRSVFAEVHAGDADPADPATATT